MNINVTMSEEEFEKFKLFRDQIRAFDLDNLKRELNTVLIRHAGGERFFNEATNRLATDMRRVVDNWGVAEKVATK